MEVADIVDHKPDTDIPTRGQLACGLRRNRLQRDVSPNGDDAVLSTDYLWHRKKSRSAKLRGQAIDVVARFVAGEKSRLEIAIDVERGAVGRVQDRARGRVLVPRYPSIWSKISGNENCLKNCGAIWARRS